MVGLPLAPIEPPGDDAVRDAGPRRLVLACAAALGVGPELVARTAGVVTARRTTAHLAHAAGLPRVELARVLGVTPQRIGQLLGQSVDIRHLRAARLQLALEDLIQATASVRATG